VAKSEGLLYQESSRDLFYSHIRLRNYCRVWCGQVSQHQRSEYLRILWD